VRGPSDDLLHELKVEYARLLIGPGRMLVPPYETLYAPKAKERNLLLMVSPESLAVERAYCEAGVAISNGLREPPDHFAAGAEFVCSLSKKEAEAGAASDNTSAKIWRWSELTFPDEHLGKWGCRFCHQVETESHHPFNRL